MFFFAGYAHIHLQQPSQEFPAVIEFDLFFGTEHFDEKIQII
jgi:hypothetical protein